MEGGGIMQRMTLSDQLSLLPPVNLGDLLKVRDDDAAVPQRNTTVTLAAVISSDMNSTSSSADAGGGGAPRTLLDVISEEEESGGSGGTSSWRNLTERLRIRHTAAAATWTAGSPSSSNPAEGGGDSGRMTTIRVSLMTLMEMREQEEEDDNEEEVEEGRAEARVTAESADDVAAELGMDDDDVAEVGSRHVCCVCMVRKKGAAFIPCGHTFCRFCSRELFLGRGNCPLCNAAISEVLDIF